MNRIYKTVWNAARRALVVVNERAGIGQTRRAAKGGATRMRKSSVAFKPALGTGNRRRTGFSTFAGIGVLALSSLNPCFAYSLPLDCSKVGSMSNGVCTIRFTAYKPLTESVVMDEGDALIDATHANFAEGSGKNLSITNKGEGTLTIRGGNGKHGISSLATGTLESGFWNGQAGATGIVENAGDGTVVIQGGKKGYSSGILSISSETTRYSGGSSGYAGGNSKGYVINSGKGLFEIKGGTGEGAYGITKVGGSSPSKGYVQNTGGGEMRISAGEYSESYGIFAVGNGGYGEIENKSGKMVVRGSSVATDAAGILTIGLQSEGLMVNRAGAEMWLLGDKSHAVEHLANPVRNTMKATGRFENYGVLYMNSMAFGSFIEGPGTSTVSWTNYGTVNTEAEAIFSKTGHSTPTTVDIGVMTEVGGKWTESKTQLSSFHGALQTWTWALKSDWSQYSKWKSGGKLVITDIKDGTQSAEQIAAAFKKKFGTGTTVSFTGEKDDAEVIAPKFSSDIANELIAKGYAGAIVTNFDLDVSAEDGSAQHVTVGQTGTNGIADSIGFRQILGASAVSVRNGKTLTLVGSIEGEELVEGGGKVDLNNGTLRLGVDAGTEESTGCLADVSIVNDSKVAAENGWFRMDSLNGTGDVSVAENGRVYAGEMTVTGSVKNEGTLSADSLDVTGNLESSKTIKSSGTISVGAGSRFVADGAVVADKFDVKGVLILGKNANVFTGAAAMDQLRKADAEAAAEIDRVEGKAEVNTMSVLDNVEAGDKIEKNSDREDGETGASAEKGGSSSPSGGTVDLSRSRGTSVLPQDARAFAAFDAVNRIASEIDAGGTPDTNGLWVKLVSGESEFGVRSGSKWKVDSDGAVVGVEAKMAPTLKVGAAFSYLDGEIDAGPAKNDWKSCGLAVYAHHRAGDFGLKGSAGWLRGTTEAVQDLDADVWHAGVRAEYDLFKGPMTVTPFLGARLMNGSFDGMASQTVASVPVGVKIAGELSTAGWTVVPALEASYVRSFGDTKAEDIRVLPENAFTGALSLKVEKGAWSGELSVRGAAGCNDYEDRAITAKVGLKF